MTSRTLRAILAATVFLTIPALPGALAAPPPDGGAVAALLDRAASSDAAEAQAALAELSQLGDPPTLAGAVSTWRAPRSEAGEHRLSIRDAAGTETDLVVRVPEGRAPPEGFPLAVLLHGLGGSSRQLIEPFGDPLVEAGFVVAAPTATRPDPPNEDAITERLTLHWWSYRPGSFPLVAIRESRRLAPIDPDRVLLVGYSMGGFGAWNIGLRYPDRFAGIIPMAGGISRAEYVGVEDRRSRSLLPNAAGLPVWFIHGDHDQVVPVLFDRRTRDALDVLGLPYTYHEIAGSGHILPVVRAGPLRDEMVQWASLIVRNPHPRRIAHTAIDPYMGRAYWTRIDEFQREGASASLVAEIHDDGTIACETQNVRRLTIFCDPALVPSNAPLRVLIDGSVAFDGPVAPSPDALVDSWRDREDPSLVYPALVRIEVPRAGR